MEPIDTESWGEGRREMYCGRHRLLLGQVGRCGVALATPDSLLKQKSRCLGCRELSVVSF